MKLIILILLSIAILPKSREVFLDTEVREASYKGLVKIESYRLSTILFRPFANPDTVMTATTGDTEPSTMEKVKFPGKPRTGYWLAIGEWAFIVIDKTNKVSLFAQEENDDYRFWNPYNMFDETLFRFSSPCEKTNGGAV